jgi:hypothetical protein
MTKAKDTDQKRLRDTVPPRIAFFRRRTTGSPCKQRNRVRILNTDSLATELHRHESNAVDRPPNFVYTTPPNLKYSYVVQVDCIRSALGRQALQTEFVICRDSPTFLWHDWKLVFRSGKQENSSTFLRRIQMHFRAFMT